MEVIGSIWLLPDRFRNLSGEIDTMKMQWLLFYALIGALCVAESVQDVNGALRFDKPPYVSPKVIKDLTTWLSDVGDQVVAVDLAGAQDSNRYSGKVLTRQTGEGRVLVYYREDAEMFGYRYVGRIADIDIVWTTQAGAGSGVFNELLFLKREKEKRLAYDSDRKVMTFLADRYVLKKVGSISLGEHFDGSVEVVADSIHIRSHKKEDGKSAAEERVIAVQCE